MHLTSQSIARMYIHPIIGANLSELHSSIHVVYPWGGRPCSYICISGSLYVSVNYFYYNAYVSMYIDWQTNIQWCEIDVAGVTSNIIL